MARLLVDERDIKFVLFDLLRVQDLGAHTRFAGVDPMTIGLLLDEARKFAEKRLFPLSIKGDRIGARFDAGQVYSVPGTRQTYLEFVEGGWLTPCENEECGGQGLPEIVKFASHEMFFAANFPFMCYVNLTHDAAKLIELFGTAEQKNLFLPKMYGGQWTGTMALTEPAAGSDVGAIAAKATRASDGSYRLSGQKMFITNGDHDVAENIVHMVLARIEGDPSGTRGLSIFIVPKYRSASDGSLGEGNDVQCVGIEHKMGLHASPTTSMVFGERGQCHAYLLGRERDGIKIMFHMMNTSRLEVGLWGQGICSVAYQHALAYAQQRKQGQSVEDPARRDQVRLIEHPDVRRALLLMKSRIEGMRVMLYFCGYAMDLAEIAVSEGEKLLWRELVDLLIPVCKAHPTEKGVEFASQAIQIYGGYGYTHEYPVEQFMRDVKVACIFEGTTGIQAMDFALRKVPMKNGRVFHDFLDRMDVVAIDLASMPGWKKHTDQFNATKSALAKLPATMFSQTTTDTCAAARLLQATPFLDAAGDLFVAYFLLWGAQVAERKLNVLCRDNGIADAASRKWFIRDNPEAAHLAGRIASARFFIGSQLPITDGKIAAIIWADASAWDVDEQSF